MLTVCTATFNALSAVGERSLRRCIGSVAALPFAHEHLVFDGGSTDGTAEFVKGVGDEALKIVSEADKGIYDALNKGLAAAKGDYFYVLGADDYIAHPEVLAECLEAVSAGGYRIFVSPVETSAGDRIPRRMESVREFVFGMAYPHQGVIASTALLRELGGYDISYSLAADYKLHLLAHWRGVRTGIGSRPFAVYGTEGVSARDNDSVEGEYARVRQEVFGLSADEAESDLSAGKLPLRIARRLLRSRDPFTRTLGRFAVAHWLWHKHCSGGMSSRYFCGLKICSHRRVK